MATLLKVHKEDKKENEKSKMKMTPEYVSDMLFYFHDAAHKFHQDTMDGWEHDAMGKLYESLVEFKDDIPEELMGYMGGKRLKGLNKIDLPDYKNKQDSVKLCEEIILFAYELYEWAGDKKYCDIENKAQDLSGVAAKTIYRLTLN